MRALVAASLMALAGCAGSAHGSATTATATSDAPTSSVSALATPFGVSSPVVIAAAPSTAPSAAPVAATAAPAAAAAAPAAVTAAPAAGAAGPSASVAGAATASAAGTAAPAAAPAVAASAVTAAPRILSVRTSPAVVHDGDTLLWNVRTTPDVVDVVAHVTVYAFRLAKHGTGAYVLTFTIPHGVPGFFHGTYTLDLVARSATGAEASTKVPVTFQ